MARTFATSVIFLISCASLWAQNPIALEYNELKLREEFSDQNDNWTYMTTVENLYMPDKGDLFMHRNNLSSAYAFITKWKNEMRTFSIMARVKLGPSETADQSIGIICLAQRDGKGGVVVEFNKFKQYRIKQLIGAYYRPISGTAEEQGWVKSGLVRAKEEYNELEVRVALPQVDVYINGKFAQSFDVANYGPGEMGLIIGPNTKAKADYFYVYSTADEAAKEEERIVENSQGTSTAEQLSKMRYDLEHKNRTISECETERRKAVSLLEEEKGQLLAENEKLTLQNRQLAEFRDQVLVDIDEDVFLTLVENLKQEVVKNERLESQVQVYRDSLKQTHANYNKLKLALLDKSIAKGQKEKAEREKHVSIATKNEIEKELLDKKMMKEQEEWEKKNFKPGTAPTPDQKKIATAAKPEKSDKVEQKPAAPTSGPLPVKVKKAEKQPD